MGQTEVKDRDAGLQWNNRETNKAFTFLSAAMHPQNQALLS